MKVFRRYRWAPLAFAGPSFAVYTYFIIVSIGFTIYYSMTRWNAISKPVQVGFRNYALMLKSNDFGIVMHNTVIALVAALVIQVLAGLAFAYLIYRTSRGFRVFRALIFLPVVLSPAVVSLMFTLVFNSDISPINRILQDVGLSALQRNWLSDKHVVLYSVLTPMIYQYIGLYVIIFLAGMQSIPEEIIESSFIDGASSFRTFFSIIIPTQLEIVFISMILITTGTFKSFVQSYIMTWGGPGVYSSFIAVYMYFRTFVDANFGYGSAVAVVILVGALFFTVLLRAILRRFDY